MSDRANIYLIDNNTSPAGIYNCGIYLYTHWCGYQWPELLRRALIVGESRWSDPPYLTRVIISELFSEIHRETTGGGVSTWTENYGHYLVTVVDIPWQTVSWASHGKEREPGSRFREMSFTDFTGQVRASYPDS